MIPRFLALSVVLLDTTCLAQGYYAVRTELLTDHNVATAFAIGNVTFVVRDSQLVGGAPELTKLLSPAQAVKAGLPKKPVADLIDNQLGGHHEPCLDVASVLNLGDDGYVWLVTWDLFPSPGGFSGIPFEYRAYVLADGSTVRPEMFLCDHSGGMFAEADDIIFSVFAFEDLPDSNGGKANDNQVRAVAERALNETTTASGFKNKFRFVGIDLQLISGALFTGDESKSDRPLWAVKFVDDTVSRADENKVDPFIVWVASDLTTSDLTVGGWNAKQRRRTKP